MIEREYVGLTLIESAAIMTNYRYGRLKLMTNDVKEISESLKIGGSLYGLKYLW